MKNWIYIIAMITALITGVIDTCLILFTEREGDILVLIIKLTVITTVSFVVASLCDDESDISYRIRRYLRSRH